MKAVIHLDTRRQKTDSTYPVVIYLRHKNKILIPTGYSVSESDYNNGTIINVPNKNVINKNLLDTLEKVNKQLSKLEVLDMLHTFSDVELKNLLMGKEVEGNFAIHYDRFVNKKTENKTKAAYNYTRSALEKYCKFNTLNFQDITFAFLSDLETHWIASGMGTNTISIHFRNIRAVINDAIKEGITDLYPFKSFKIKSAKTIKRSLSADSLAKLFAIQTDSSAVEFALDMFKLSFYLIGINPKDLFLAKLSDIHDGRLDYIRSKTDGVFSVKIEPEAMAIIEKHKGFTNIIGRAEENVNYENLRKRLTKRLQSIKGCKELTLYWSRHTWATIAYELDVSDDTIAQALGHQGVSPVTDRYIRRNTRKIDEANRKVIDYINSIIEFNAL